MSNSSGVLELKTFEQFELTILTNLEFEILEIVI